MCQKPETSTARGLASSLLPPASTEQLDRRGARAGRHTTAPDVPARHLPADRGAARGGASAGRDAAASRAREQGVSRMRMLRPSRTRLLRVLPEAITLGLLALTLLMKDGPLRTSACVLIAVGWVVGEFMVAPPERRRRDVPRWRVALELVALAALVALVAEGHDSIALALLIVLLAAAWLTHRRSKRHAREALP